MRYAPFLVLLCLWLLSWGAGCARQSVSSSVSVPARCADRGTPSLVVRERNATVRVIPAPSLKADIDGVEVDEDGGQSFTWHVTAKNNEQRAIDLTVSTKFTVDTNEEIAAIPLEFVLQPGESRSISGPPVHLKKRFHEVNGTSTETAKHYVK